MNRLEKNARARNIDAQMIANQQAMSPVQRALVASHPHLFYVKPRRVRMTPDQRYEIYEQAEGYCHYCICEIDPDDFHVDHKHPISRGGSNDPDNLVAACPDCNIKKGAIPYDEFRI